MQRCKRGTGGGEAEGFEKADDKVGDAPLHSQQGFEGGGKNRSRSEGHKEIQELHHAAVSLNFVYVIDSFETVLSGLSWKW